MLVLLAVIGFIIFQALPTSLVQWSANMSNLAALIMPIALMYLISRLPGPARARWWSYAILSVVVVFFGFFFINFVYDRITGDALVTF
jgi:TRAP-type C4-dicarboxylate transport system permease small subunit